MFGAALVPLSQTVLLDINPKEKHGQAMAMWGAGIMVGPIAGPVLGGWLTDAFNWRWTFFVNLPVGILAFLIAAAYLPRVPKRLRGFDFFGFTVLSIGVGALQLMLDRGEQVDWFNSMEIWIYLCLTIAGFWVFIVHLLTGKNTFIDPKIFLDRNFATGLVFIFVIGIVLFSSLALLPPMLANLFNHPTVTTGIVMAPRGVGTMISMLLVGRLVRIVDARILVITGLLLTASSLYDMTGFSPQMDDFLIVTSGIVQGLGLGLVFVPLSTIAFATLEPRFRADAASLFSLVRNIGSGIGISIVTVVLTQSAQINHTEVGAAINPYNPMLWMASPSAASGDPTALARLDQLVNQQSMMISYVNDFWLMMLVTLLAVPLTFMLRKPKAAPMPGSAPAVHAE
jgi:DHA2 family multidrug resistance protein